MKQVALNDRELAAMLKKPLQNGVNKVTGNVAKKNSKLMKSVVYSYPATEYIRTGQFGDAWKADETGNVGNIANGTFEYDKDEVSVGSGWPETAPYSGVHQSFVDGTPSADKLPDYIFNGYQGALKKHIPARNAFNELDDWVSEDRIKLYFKRGLTAAKCIVTQEGGATKTTK